MVLGLVENVIKLNCEVQPHHWHCIKSLAFDLLLRSSRYLTIFVLIDKNDIKNVDEHHTNLDDHHTNFDDHHRKF